MLVAGGSCALFALIWEQQQIIPGLSLWRSPSTTVGQSFQSPRTLNVQMWGFFICFPVPSLTAGSSILVKLDDLFTSGSRTTWTVQKTHLLIPLWDNISSHLDIQKQTWSLSHLRRFMGTLPPEGRGRGTTSMCTI